MVNEALWGKDFQGIGTFLQIQTFSVLLFDRMTESCVVLNYFTWSNHVKSKTVHGSWQGMEVAKRKKALRHGKSAHCISSRSSITVVLAL